MPLRVRCPSVDGLCLTSAVQTPELADLVPDLMAAHPLVGWEASAPEQDEDLVVDLRLIADPTRAAQVLVNAGGEVFTFRFAGHDSADFAYGGDLDQVETLTERLELASLALIGPTRIVLTTDGDQVLRSEMVIDPEGPHPRSDVVTSWPLRRLRSRLLLRRATEQVLTFEGTAPS